MSTTVADTVDEDPHDRSPTLAYSSSTPHSAHSPSQGGGALSSSWTSDPSRPFAQHHIPAVTDSYASAEPLNAKLAIKGWPFLAQAMAAIPDLKAFPRFDDLNTKNLLYYQVELQVLKEKLRRQEERDWKIRETRKDMDYATYADKLVRSQTSEEPRQRKQWDMVLKMRTLLKEYNEALLLHSKVSALPEPSTGNMDFLVSWVQSPKGGNYCVAGSGSDVWGPLFGDETGTPPSVKSQLWQLLRKTFWPGGRTHSRCSNLVTTEPSRKVDGITNWIQEELVPCLHGCVMSYKATHPSKKTEKDEEGQAPGKCQEIAKKMTEEEAVWYEMGHTKTLSENMVLKVTSGLATVVACLLPTGAIAVLTTAHGIRDKLLYIGGFTLLFSLALIWFTTEISRLQIFSATAAFSAVLVVFVQGGY